MKISYLSKADADYAKALTEANTLPALRALVEEYAVLV